MSERLYTEQGHYTEAAFRLAEEIHHVLDPLFARYVERGFSPREIAHVMLTCVQDQEMVTMLDQMKRERRDLPPPPQVDPKLLKKGYC